MKQDSKKTRLLKLLMIHRNKFISCRDIITTIHTAHHTSLIKSLRDEWHQIENDFVYDKASNKMHSSYRLVTDKKKTLTELFNELFTNVI